MSPNIVSHPRLMPEPMIVASDSKCRCPIATEESNALDDSFRSTKKSRSSGVGEGKAACQGKKAASGIFLSLTSLANFPLACFS